jgi:hypothetical protein
MSIDSSPETIDYATITTFEATANITDGIYTLIFYMVDNTTKSFKATKPSEWRGLMRLEQKFIEFRLANIQDE